MAERSSEAASVTQGIRRDALRFAEADVDGNSKLSFEEFLDMQPRGVLQAHSEHEIRSWFNDADLDDDGTVSINEFFVWSMKRHALRGMDKMRSVFDKYDKNDTGAIDAIEFQKLCDDIGFGTHAHEIFMDLDHDKQGTISFTEIMEQLMGAVTESPVQNKLKKAKSFEERVHVRRNSTRKESSSPPLEVESSLPTKQLLMAMVWTEIDDKSDRTFKAGGQGLDVSAWKIDASDAAGLVQQLRDQVISAGATVNNLIELFNFEAGGSRSETDFFDVTEKEFVKAMRTRLRYTGSLSVIKGAFRLLGGDDGKVEVDELFEFVTGRTNSMRMKETKVSLEGLVLEPLMAEAGEEWTVEALRKSIQSMLISHKYAPHILLQAWDVDGDHRLSKNEFFAKMKRLVVEADGSRSDLWYDGVRPAVGKVFAQLCDKSKKAIELSTFSAFLNQGWPSSRPKQPAAQQPAPVEAAAEEAESSLPKQPTPKRADRRAVRREPVQHRRPTRPPPQIVDMAPAERRFARAQPGPKARPLPTPLYDSKVACKLTSSVLRLPKARPFSRGIWDGAIDGRWDSRVPGSRLPPVALSSSCANIALSPRTVSPRIIQGAPLEESKSSPMLNSVPARSVKASVSFGTLPDPATDGAVRGKKGSVRRQLAQLAGARRLRTQLAMSDRYGYDAGHRTRAVLDAFPLPEAELDIEPEHVPKAEHEVVLPPSGASRPHPFRTSGSTVVPQSR